MEQKQERKKSRKGALTQKHVSFRCDNENIVWLDQQSNKGRYINELIAADRAMKKGGGQ